MAGYKAEVIAIEHILHCMIVIVGTRMRRSLAGYKAEVIAIEHILHCMIVIVGTRMRRSLVYRNIPCNYVYCYEL